MLKSELVCDGHDCGYVFKNGELVYQLALSVRRVDSGMAYDPQTAHKFPHLCKKCVKDPSVVFALFNQANGHFENLSTGSWNKNHKGGHPKK